MQQVADDIAERIEGLGPVASAQSAASHPLRGAIGTASSGTANPGSIARSTAASGKAQRFGERRGRTRSSLAWGASGFIVGAVFWHMIGFWAFVSDVVFSSHAPIEERYVDQAGANCVEIILDRATGRVFTEDCAAELPLLDERATSVKSDFLSGGRGRLARPQRPVRVTSGAR